jgi:hypothetical protein
VSHFASFARHWTASSVNEVAEWDFLTVADELLVPALAAADYFSDLGYTVTPEKHEAGCPFTPTLSCKRAPTTCFVEVAERASVARMKELVGFASALDQDTRVYLVLLQEASLSATVQMQLSNLGVGLLFASTAGVTEAMAAQDVAMRVTLPELRRESRRLKRILGPVYELIKRNQWREGFDEACIALETEARAYLWKSLKSGRTTVLTPKGNQKALTKAKVDKMTMGALAIDFANMQQQNQADSVVGQTLQLLNEDRIRIAHKRRSAAAERALRRNVPPQMWRIIAALKALDKA